MRRSFAVSLFLCAHAIGAQVRGTVVDPAHAPIAGAVIAVLDSTGKTVTRTITSAVGQFAFPATVHGATLRATRIGFRPVVRAFQEGNPIEITMERIPSLLDAFRVVGKELCPGSTDANAAFQLWQQVRDALSATVVARELSPATMQTVVYESGMSPDDDLIHRQTKRVAVGRNSRPFGAGRPATFFADKGFMIDALGERTFYAPDADVLVDDSFQSTHCFNLQTPDSAHAGQIGLAFTPARGREGIVDVRGVVWVDVQSPQLRSMDVLFTSLEPASMRVHPGAHVEFHTGNNGLAFIDRWWMRLANPRLDENTMDSHTTRAVDTDRALRRDVRIAEVVETGGMVLQAKWPDGSTWSALPSVLAGSVVQKKTGAVSPGAMVSLVGTADTVWADANGEFEFEAIAGKYQLLAVDTTLSSFLPPRSEKTTVTVTQSGIATARLQVASIEGSLGDLCRERRMTKETSALSGVLSVEGRAVPTDAVIQVRWHGAPVQTKTGVVQTDESQLVNPDEKGRFLVCGVPRDQPITVAVIKKRGSIGDTTITIGSNQLVANVDWFLSPTQLASADTQRVTTLAPMTTTATVRSPVLKAFDARRAIGNGNFLSDSFMVAHSHVMLDVVLGQFMSQVRILRAGARAHVVAKGESRFSLSGFRNVTRCFSTVYVDGEQKFRDTDIQNRINTPFDIASISVGSIAAVEFYPGNSPIPKEFTPQSRCGTLVIWTREYAGMQWGAPKSH